MNFSVLGSGSGGNSVYADTGETAILIDCGFSGKEITCRLESIGKNAERLAAIIITHEHIDHIAGAGVMARKYDLPVYANAGTFLGAAKKIGKLPKPIEFETGTAFTIGDLDIRSFRISHDTADPVGFILKSHNSALGYCTDTGKATHLMAQRLKECNGLILEFNHDPEMLKNGPYPLALQQRVRSEHGHLSNQEATDFLDIIHHGKMKHVVLAHLSETNNLPDIAIAGIKANRKNYGKTQFHIASQHQPTSVLTI
ncbi:MAG: MBL fold metallo-hydrolase [Deltaproteobacteria bacterium]|nr:MAG: MBL fold metallo-hydrolase [Deltaproteobacteria bacterium]